jgi:ABC-type uncharacterized transport system ATPase subunit
LSLAITMSGITQIFGSFHALEDVTMSVPRNQIHAVIGENGAGKTTLMKVLKGEYKATSGAVEFFDEGGNACPAPAIGMVSQHYGIIPELTNLQNLILGAEPSYILDSHSARERATTLAAQMGMEFDWDDMSHRLSPARAQKLEILKLLWRDSEIMILDEPTAMLSPADSDSLFANLKELAASGRTILVVTHRLGEVMEHCASLTVLRGGKKIADRQTSETNPAELAELIVGRTVDAAPERVHVPDSKAVALEVKNLTVLGYRGEEAVKGANFSIRQGEIVGLAGVDGNGQRELFHAIMGVVTPRAGEVRWNGADITSLSVANRLELGFRLIAEDRLHEAVIEDWSLTDNVLLGSQRVPELRNGSRIQFEEVASLADKVLKRFSTKYRTVESKMKSLSGGNQQRVVAARALAIQPNLILAFQPTRGLDIAGTSDVYAAIQAECDKGACALVVSFDLDELIERCDRVMAINRGTLHVLPEELRRDRQEIGQRMVME